MIHRTTHSDYSETGDAVFSSPPQESRTAAPDRFRYFALKAAVDRFLAVLLLVVLSPVLLACMALVRCTSRGPAIFKQVRAGKNGKPYTMYKLRSMTHDIEKVSGMQWSQPGDPRVTPVGRFLRRTHLDEIPQLFNVIRGDMALVGPRPERPEIVELLTPLVKHYSDRLAVKPGITGLAQIFLPPDSDLESVQLKTRYDRLYIQHTGPVMDLRILACTVLRLLCIRGGIGPRITGLAGMVERVRSRNRSRNLLVASRNGEESRVNNAKSEMSDDSWGCLNPSAADSVAADVESALRGPHRRTALPVAHHAK
jgi:lipopolysaccharide/colanic/teichoic acid biosynthesis glycosyltransferase